jgi:hypothetical protein
MIIVRLTGGLGNQMFQYAMGRGLSHRLESRLKLDISLLKHNPQRSYSLKHLNIIEDFASAKEIYRFSGVPQTLSQKISNRIFGSAFRDADRKFSQNKPLAYSEPHFHFDPKALELQGDIYLRGYWQSEKYFKDIKHIIRDEFTVKNRLDAKNLAVAKQIHSCESVSLHVRRGDYAASAVRKRTHGVCSLEYYQAAIEKMKKHFVDLHFFVFSDDPQWVASNMHVTGPSTIVDHNGPEEAHEDLRLMSLCRNHILANSTFSWWAAWLKSSRSGIVIAPQKWFGEERMQTRRMDDLFLSDWYIL